MRYAHDAHNEISVFNASGRIAYVHNEIIVFIESNAIHGYA
jgi:hypothetical protein